MNRKLRGVVPALFVFGLGALASHFAATSDPEEARAAQDRAMVERAVHALELNARAMTTLAKPNDADVTAIADIAKAVREAAQRCGKQ